MSTLSMQSGVTGMKTNQSKLNVIGNNVANMSTTAFKRGEMRFEDVLYQMEKFPSAPTGTIGGINPSQVGSGVGVAGIVKYMEQGTMQTTGRPSDFGINGAGFFTLERDGEVVYTRDGSFSLDADGNLVNSNGYRVIGEDDNPINIPQEVNVAGQDIKVLSYNVSLDGTVSLGLADGTTLKDHAKFKVAQFQNPEGLEQLGNNLYIPSPNSGDPVFGADGAGGIMQGYLEGSNVDIVDEFTAMMIANKGLQAASKVVTTSDQALDTVLSIIR